MAEPNSTTDPLGCEAVPWHRICAGGGQRLSPTPETCVVKKPKLPKPKKVRRNPHARALASPLFQSRVVKGPGVYRRRPKHQKAARVDEEA